MDGFEAVQEIAKASGGTIKEVMDFGNGHGGAILSIPLRKDHWLYQKDDTPAGFKSNVPPMPFRMGAEDTLIIGHDKGNIGALIKSGQQRVAAVTLTREQMAQAIRAAGKYAARCATMNGSEMDFDPDALLQNLVVGFLGYWTENGLTGNEDDSKWCDPQGPFDFGPPTREHAPGGGNAVQAQGCEATGSAPAPPATEPDEPTGPAQMEG